MNTDKADTDRLVSDDHYRDLRFNLLHTCSWVNNGMRKFLKPYDVTPKQYNILRILKEHAPESLSIQQIREMLADKMSDASRLVDRLERKELLKKFPSDHDRRSNRARITGGGQALLKAIDGGREALDTLISERLSDAEVEQLNALLDRLK